MKWVGSDAKNIYGVIDAAATKPVLPMLSKEGHWADFRKVADNRFPEASEAKKAIAEHGNYLMGAGVTVTEAFGKL